MHSFLTSATTSYTGTLEKSTIESDAMLSNPVITLLKYAILVFLILHSAQVVACKCAEEKSVKKSFERADLVISGVVQDVQYLVRPKHTLNQTTEQQLNDTIRVASFQHLLSLTDTLLIISKIVEVKVESLFKGQPGSIVRLNTGSGFGDCGYAFEQGKAYLIYAFSQNPSHETVVSYPASYYTDECTRTSILQETSDTAKLEKLKKDND